MRHTDAMQDRSGFFLSFSFCTRGQFLTLNLLLALMLLHCSLGCRFRGLLLCWQSLEVAARMRKMHDNNTYSNVFKTSSVSSV